MSYEQTTLGVESESLSQRERWLVSKLRDYAVIDEDIQACKNTLASDPPIPSITIRPPEEDDAYIRGRLKEPLRTDWQRETAATIAKHVDSRQWQYVSVARVNRVLSNTYSEDTDEDYRIRDAADATKRSQEERVELTPTERAIVNHQASMEEAAARMLTLQHRKRIITGALGIMESHYPDWYTLIVERYIRGQKYEWYLMHYGLSERGYRTERKNALKKFDRLAVGLR